MGRARLVDARRPAGKDDRQRVQLADSLCRDVVADDPREGMPLANPARDELDVLGTEIKDEYGAFEPGRNPSSSRFLDDRYEPDGVGSPGPRVYQTECSSLRLPAEKLAVGRQCHSHVLQRSTASPLSTS